MKELIVLVAKAMTQEQIVEKISEAIDKYKEAVLLGQDVEEAVTEIEMSTHLFLLNKLDKTAGEILKQMDNVHKSVEFFNLDKN